MLSLEEDVEKAWEEARVESCQNRIQRRVQSDVWYVWLVIALTGRQRCEDFTIQGGLQSIIPLAIWSLLSFIGQNL